MKIKNKTILIAITAIVILLVLLVCLLIKNNQPSEHIHTYTSQYLYDDISHWRAATCEHKSEITDFSVHFFNETYACNTCGFQKTINPDLKTDEQTILKFDLIPSVITIYSEAQTTCIKVNHDALELKTDREEMIAEFHDLYYDFYIKEGDEWKYHKIESDITAESYLYSIYPILQNLTSICYDNAPLFMHNKNNKTLSWRSNNVGYTDFYCIAQLDEADKLLYLTIQYIANDIRYEMTISFTGEAIAPPAVSTLKLNYQVINETECIITGKGNLEQSSISIPSEIDGYTVVGIGDDAFKNTETLVNLTLPDTIKTIGKSAFEGCSQLTYVYIGKNVVSIGERAFADIPVEADIHIFDKVVSYGADAFIQTEYRPGRGRVFFYGDIDTYATASFANHFSSPFERRDIYINEEKVKEIILDAATYISDYAFYFCRDIRTFKFGKQITSIGTEALGALPTDGYGAYEQILTWNIYYDGNLNDWINIDFGLYWALGSGYNLYFAGTEVSVVTFPEGQSSVPQGVFYNCRSLISITLPKGYTTIESQAFSNCPLIYFKAEDTLETVKEEAFVIDVTNVSWTRSAFIKENGVYYVGPEDNPYLICIGYYSENYVVNKDCKIIQAQFEE